MAKQTTHTWKGVWDEGAGGYVEYFGEPDGLPARDLTDDDVRGFTAEQKAKLRSETGQRLYHEIERRDAKPTRKLKIVKPKPAAVEPDPAAPDTGAESTGAVSDAGVPEGSAGGA